MIVFSNQLVTKRNRINEFFFGLRNKGKELCYPLHVCI